MICLLFYEGRLALQSQRTSMIKYKVKVLPLNKQATFYKNKEVL